MIYCCFETWLEGRTSAHFLLQECHTLQKIKLLESSCGFVVSFSNCCRNPKGWMFRVSWTFAQFVKQCSMLSPPISVKFLQQSTLVYIGHGACILVFSLPRLSYLLVPSIQESTSKQSQVHCRVGHTKCTLRDICPFWKRRKRKRLCTIM